MAESLQFYWEVTNKFNNWEAYHSDNSSDISTVTNSISNLTIEMSSTTQQKVTEQAGSPNHSDTEGGNNPPAQTHVKDEGWEDQDQSYARLNINDNSYRPVYQQDDDKQSIFGEGTGFGENFDDETIKTPSISKKTVGFVHDMAKKE